MEIAGIYKKHALPSYNSTPANVIALVSLSLTPCFDDVCWMGIFALF